MHAAGAAGEEAAEPVIRTVPPALLALVVLALSIRLYGLDARTLTHPEAYVPRIPFPAYATAPRERQTLGQVLVGTRDQDVHPPAFYVLAWLWAGVVGAGLFAIRLPSALLGAGTVAVFYGLARRDASARVAVLAAGLLALHGHHVFWSQHARPWALLTLLAVLSTLLLRQLADRWSLGRATLYVGVTALGLWTGYYFWPVVASQGLWALTRGARGLLGLSAVAVVLGSPVLVLARLHAERPSYLASDPGAPLLNLLAFGRVVDVPATAERVGWAAAGLLVVAGAAALVAGLQAAPPHGTAPASARPWLTMALANAALAVSAFLVVAGEVVHGGRPKLLAAGLVLPWAALAGWLVTGPAWGAVARLLRPVAWLGGDLTAMVALAPVLLLVGLSVVTPVLAERALLVLAPFWLLLMVRGVGRLLTSPRRLAGAWAVVLVLGGASTYLGLTRPNHPIDYQSLVDALRPRLQAGDVVVVANAWWAQPVHYYLPDVERVAPEAIPAEAGRIWYSVLGERNAVSVPVSVDGRVEVERVTARGALAILFVRPE